MDAVLYTVFGVFLVTFIFSFMLSRYIERGIKELRDKGHKLVLAAVTAEHAVDAFRGLSIFSALGVVTVGTWLFY